MTLDQNKADRKREERVAAEKGYNPPPTKMMRPKWTPPRPSRRLTAVNDFVECIECAVKAGTPALCAVCLANRCTIQNLKTEIEQLHESDARRNVTIAEMEGRLIREAKTASDEAAHWERVACVRAALLSRAEKRMENPEKRGHNPPPVRNVVPPKASPAPPRRAYVPTLEDMLCKVISRGLEIRIMDGGWHIHMKVPTK